MKLNTDATNLGNQLWGFGAVFRNGVGVVRVRATIATKIHGVFTVDIAENLTIRWALTIASHNGL